MKNRTVVLSIVLVAGFALLAAACGSDDGGRDDADQATEVDEATDSDADPDDDGAETGTGEGGGDSDDTGTGEAVSDDTGTGDTDAMTPVRGGELDIGASIDGTGFNTLTTMQPGSIRILLAMTDPLVGSDREGQWQPALAEALTPNDDATVWTITLRAGPTFHDGAPVDAEAVKANFDAFRSSPDVGFVLAPVEDVTVIDPLTLEVTMNRSWGAFPYALIGQPGWLVSPDTLGTNDSFTGTGPFVFESWVPNDRARMVRNDDYWRSDEGLPYLDAVNFKVIPEPSARRAALETGEIDMYVTPQDFDIIDFREQDGDIEVLLGSESGGSQNEALVLLNTAVAPTDDLRVRQAMAHSLDRQLIVETFRSGLNEVAEGFIDPDSRFWVDVDYPELDPDRARDLVDEYETEVGPAEINLIVQNRPGVIEVAELAESFWEEVGIDIEIELVEPGADVPRVFLDDFQAITWFQFGQGDPDREYPFFHSSGGLLNWSNLVEPDIDAGFDAGRESLDDDARAVGYAMVQEAMARELPMLWIDHIGGTDGLAVASYVHDVDRAAFANGTPGEGLSSGSFHVYGQIWMDE